MINANYYRIKYYSFLEKYWWKNYIFLLAKSFYKNHLVCWIKTKEKGQGNRSSRPSQQAWPPGARGPGSNLTCGPLGSASAAARAGCPRTPTGGLHLSGPSPTSSQRGGDGRRRGCRCPQANLGTGTGPSCLRLPARGRDVTGGGLGRRRRGDRGGRVSGWC